MTDTDNTPDLSEPTETVTTHADAVKLVLDMSILTQDRSIDGALAQARVAEALGLDALYGLDEWETTRCPQCGVERQPSELLNPCTDCGWTASGVLHELLAAFHAKPEANRFFGGES